MPSYSYAIGESSNTFCGLSGLIRTAVTSFIWGVRIIPGQIAFTIILSFTTSRASAFVKPISAALVVA